MKVLTIDDKEVKSFLRKLGVNLDKTRKVKITFEVGSCVILEIEKFVDRDDFKNAQIELKSYELKEKDAEHKFKVGEKIRFIRKLDENNNTENESYFSEDMRYLEDREPREILSIDYECVGIPNAFEAELEGIIGSWVYYEDDFEKVEE